jgi:hypothetical protein
MADPFYEKLAQTRLDAHLTSPRPRSASFADAGFRRQLHAVVLMMAAVVGMTTGLLVGDLVSAPLVGLVMGAYGLYLWRR